ncbi:MAG TPA: hypothetical protein VK422_17735 [Pyrinomonadaceae bacterium]|nr:hypothetical protein [Pyrinomonadaceae bacterium]
MSREKTQESPRRIIDLVTERKNAIEQDPTEAEKNARLAVMAITEGRGSKAWRDYMLQFVEKDPAAPDEPLNPAHLARLMAEDNTADNYDMNRRRAYLLGNAICGGLSPTEIVPTVQNPRGLNFTVDTIDEGL